MNVLFLSEIFYPHGGGAEFATYLYAKLLSEKEFNIVVVTNRFGSEPEVSKSKNLIVYRLPLFRGNKSIKYSILRRIDFLFSRFLKKLVEWADVVYVPRFWYSAVLLAKAYRKPVVTHLHDYTPICPLANLYDGSKDFVCQQKGLLCPQKCICIHERNQRREFGEAVTSVLLNSTVGPILGKLTTLSDAVICVSKAQRNLIITRIPLLNQKTHLIYNPLPELSPLSLEGDAFGYFGGSSFLKGFNVLCHALILLPEGWGRFYATNFRNPREGLVKLLDRLAIIAYGRLDSGLFENIYRQIRVVVAPSVWPEPLPYVVSEAILRQRLVVASSIGGIPELVEGCEGAFLFAPGNYRALAEKLEYLSGLSREIVADLGAQSREVLTKRFCNEKTIDEFVNVLSRLT